MRRIKISVFVFHLFLFCLLLISTSSCHNKDRTHGEYSTENEQGIISFENESFDQIINLPFDSLFDDYDVTILELTQEQNILGGITDILELDDTIVLIDNQKSITAQLFTKSGRFIKTIGKIGKGPEEYLSIKHARINSSQRRIDLHDHLQSKLLSYKLNGEYISERRVFSSADFLHSSKHRKYYFYTKYSPTGNGDRYRLTFTDGELNILGGFFGYPKEKKQRFIPRMVSNFYESDNGRIFFTEVFGNKVYEINNQKLELIHKMTFPIDPPDNLIDEVLVSKQTDQYSKLRKKYFRITGEFILEMDKDFYSFDIVEPKSQIIYHVLKFNGKRFVYNNITHKEGFRLLKMNNILHSDGTLTFCYQHSPNEMDKLKEGKLKTKLESLNLEYYNPILITCHLRKQS